jgi:hypothetical protein
MKAVYQTKWHDAALSSFRDDRGQGKLQGEAVRWDAHALLTVMWDQWNRVFRHRLGMLERSQISELREFRNRWAHQADFDFDDTYRILDSVERLLRAADAKEAERIARDKRELLRARFGQEARAAYRKTQIIKRKWQDFSIYIICCAAIDFVIISYFGWSAWFFALFVVFVFGYLAYQRLITPVQIHYGPHECDGCGKIIYGETCPYCEMAPVYRGSLPDSEAEGSVATEPVIESTTETVAPKD